MGSCLQSKTVDLCRFRCHIENNVTIMQCNRSAHTFRVTPILMLIIYVKCMQIINANNSNFRACVRNNLLHQFHLYHIRPNNYFRRTEKNKQIYACTMEHSKMWHSILSFPNSFDSINNNSETNERS